MRSMHWAYIGKGPATDGQPSVETDDRGEGVASVALMAGGVCTRACLNC